MSPAVQSRSTTHAITIRPANATDVTAIVDLLAEQEFTRPLTKSQLAVLFNHQWDTKPDYGIVLVTGNRVVGVVNTIYSRPRLIGGEWIRTVNSGTLFVLPRYRARRMDDSIVRYSEELAQAIAQKGLPVSVFSARGPKNVVPEILRGVGFREICPSDLFYTAGSNLRTACWPHGTVTSGVAVQERITAEQRVLLDDHAPHDCQFYVVEAGGRRAFIVTKRRRCRGERLWPWMGISRVEKRSFLVTDVLHISEPDVAVGAWGRLVARICTAERTVGVTCSRMFFGRQVPAGREIPQATYAFGPPAVVGQLDKLYSEAVLLP
jgi:hypothetical protein